MLGQSDYQRNLEKNTFFMKRRVQFEQIKFQIKCAQFDQKHMLIAYSNFEKRNPHSVSTDKYMLIAAKILF